MIFVSWNVSATSVSADKVEEQLKKSKDAQLDAASFDSWDDLVEKQIDLAIAKAASIAKSGAVGEGPFNFSLYGHASSGAEPHSVTVIITGRPVKK